MPKKAKAEIPSIPLEFKDAVSRLLRVKPAPKKKKAAKTKKRKS